MLMYKDYILSLLLLLLLLLLLVSLLLLLQYPVAIARSI